MKSLKKIYSILLLVLLALSSCSLDKEPIDEFEDGEIWKSEKNALLSLTGIYRAKIVYNLPEFTPTDWWSYSGVIFMEFPTDNAYDRRGANSGFHRMTNGTLLSDNNFVSNYWANSYAKISRTNIFLDGIEKLNGSESAKARFRAEARFLRAAQYFYLSQFFGSVPIITKPLSLEEANSVPRHTQKEVVDFAITELSEAAKDLPRYKDLASSEMGRASKQAALAFLGRLYLADKNFAKAADTYKEIIDYGDNSIDPNYSSIFLPSNKSSKEIIFATQYMEGLAGSGLPQHGLAIKDGGWCLINVASSLFEAYDFTDGTPFSYDDSRYDPKNLGKNRDPRLDYTMYYDGATFMGTTYQCHPDNAESKDRIMSGQTTQTGLMMRKFFDEGYKGDLNSYGTNIPIIRYAEILLSYLEAKLEKGDAITPDLLNETINKVRGRQSVNMPPVTVTNPDALRKIVRNERRVELAMEGIRYWDLLRWEIAHEELTKDILGAPFPGSERVSKLPDGTVDPYGRWYVATRNFRKDKDYKWPIPQHEQDINPNLRD